MMGGQAMSWMWVWSTLVVAGLLIIGYAIVRLMQSRPGTGAGPTSSARRILDERYARGEIDEQEYLQRRRLLA